MAKSRGEIESDIQNLMSLLQNTREQAEELRTQGELLRISLEEHRTAIDTLEQYKDVKEGEEVLVPVGANAFLFANSSSTKNAVTELGAGLSAALPIPVAVEKLRKRIEKIDASRRRVLEGGAKLENSAASLEQQVQGLYQQLQTGEAPRQARPASSGAQSHAGHSHTGHAHSKGSKRDEDED